MHRSPFKIILIFIVLVITGLSLFPLLPFKLNPSGSLPSLTVSYSWNGANGRVIEQEITSVLEGAFSRVRGLENISSRSSNGWGQIDMNFGKNTDIDDIRFEISTIIRQTYPALPQGSSYPQIYIQKVDKNSDRPLLLYTINANASPFLIQQYAENKIKPLISSVKGVSSINVYGATPMEWTMEYDANVLKEYSITISDIQSALNGYLYTGNAGLGYELIPGKGMSVIHVIINNHSRVNINFNDIPVKKQGNRIVYLKDIVTIKHVEQQPTSFYRINGANTINIIVYAGNDQNQVKLGGLVKEKMAIVEKNLPEGYFILNNYDATTYIKKELNKNFVRTIATLVILLIFVLIISRELKFLMLIIISLIANLSIAFIFYYFFKIEMHLYSLAGITVSLGLIIDNSIMMIFHYRQQHNIKVFLASLAANLSTIGSLSAIFFVDDRLRSYLGDLGIVIIINLFVSLGVVLFLLPSLMDVLHLPVKQKISKRKFIFFKRKAASKFRGILNFNRIYFKVNQFLGKFKVAFCILAILGFGLPVFMLPQKLENAESLWAKTYNNTIGSKWFNSNARALTEKIMGGALRLFVKHSFENSFYGDKQKTILYIRPQTPPGTTMEQMNDLLIPLERYLKQFKEIEQFQSHVNTNEAQITVYFKEEVENGNFPNFLKEMAIQEANDLSGANWMVLGVGDGFSNGLSESIGTYRLNLYGYNFDELYIIAQKIQTELLKSQRVKRVNIMSESTWNKNSYEFVLGFDQRQLSNLRTNPISVYSSLSGYTRNSSNIGTTIVNGQLENVIIASKQGKSMDIWQVQHSLEKTGKSAVRLKNISSIVMEPVSMSINKENQQYGIIIAYDYIGDSYMSNSYQKKILKEITPKLPIGYSIKINSGYNYWDRESKKQYWLLVLIIAIIFFIGAVLFESLMLPFAVILMIPISYIGIFLTFFFFGLNFDQGGFAAFVLLSGITVSEALYIINDYNNLRYKYKNTSRHPKMLFYKAFNYKIAPILLIILSIILGLIPFLWGGQKEVFWPALAAGTIGGLIFSIIGLVFYLPLFLGVRIKYK
jgi:multidrug efflux pump subunit AcrB